MDSYKRSIDPEGEKEKRLDEAKRARKVRSDKKLMERRQSSTFVESNGVGVKDGLQEGNWGDEEVDNVEDMIEDEIKNVEKEGDPALDILELKKKWLLQNNRVEDSATEEAKWNFTMTALLANDESITQCTGAFAFIKEAFLDFKKVIANLTSELSEKEQMIADLRKDVDGLLSRQGIPSWKDVVHRSPDVVDETNMRDKISTTAFKNNPALQRKGAQEKVGKNKNFKKAKGFKLSSAEIDDIVNSSVPPTMVIPIVEEGGEVEKVTVFLPLPPNGRVDFKSKQEIWVKKMKKLGINKDKFLRRNSSIYGNKVDMYVYGPRVKEVRDKLSIDGFKIVNQQDEATAPKEYVKLHKERQITVLKQSAFRIANLLGSTRDTRLREAITKELHDDIIQEAIELESKFRSKAGKFSYDPHGF